MAWKDGRDHILAEHDLQVRVAIGVSYLYQGNAETVGMLMPHVEVTESAAAIQLSKNGENLCLIHDWRIWKLVNNRRGYKEG